MRFIKTALLLGILIGSGTGNAGAVIYKDVGTGADVSYLLLQFSPTDVISYAYHYDYVEANQLNGANLILNIDTLDSLFEITVSTGSPSSGFFIWEMSYNGNTLPTYSETGNYSWTSFVSGGSQLRYDLNFQPVEDEFGNPVYDPASTGIWSFSSAGPSDRLITPGSSDGWVFGEYASDWSSYIGDMPAVSPIPEPRSLLLFGLTALGSVWLWRKRR